MNARPVDCLNGEPRLDIATDSLTACLLALDAHPGWTVPEGSIDVAFVDVAACCRLHKDFFGDPEPTDVMTFPGDPDDGHAGDIAICPEVAVRAAAENESNFPAELTLYLVHAWLHLAGLDDRDPRGRAQMRQAEQCLLGHLSDQGALLRASWQD